MSRLLDEGDFLRSEGIEFIDKLVGLAVGGGDGVLERGALVVGGGGAQFGRGATRRSCLF